MVTGCKSDASYAEAKDPPPSDPAKLHRAMDKLDEVYKASYDSKYSAELAANELAVGTSLYRGDAASAAKEISKEHDLYREAASAVKPTLVELSKNTQIVGAADHDTYANFYNAEGDRLNAKAAEYEGFLNLKPNASKQDIATLLNLVADSRIKEYVAQKLKSE